MQCKSIPYRCFTRTIVLWWYVPKTRRPFDDKSLRRCVPLTIRRGTLVREHTCIGHIIYGAFHSWTSHSRDASRTHVRGRISRGQIVISSCRSRQDNANQRRTVQKRKKLAKKTNLIFWRTPHQTDAFIHWLNVCELRSGFRRKLTVRCPTFSCISEKQKYLSLLYIRTKYVWNTPYAIRTKDA